MRASRLSLLFDLTSEQRGSQSSIHLESVLKHLRCFHLNEAVIPYYKKPRDGFFWAGTEFNVSGCDRQQGEEQAQGTLSKWVSQHWTSQSTNEHSEYQQRDFSKLLGVLMNTGATSSSVGSQKGTQGTCRAVSLQAGGLCFSQCFKMLLCEHLRQRFTVVPKYQQPQRALIFH